MITSSTYSPWSMLPAPEPRTVSPPLDYFYDHVAKHLIKDTVRIMSNGLPIDLDRVQQLESSIQVTLDEATARITSNPYVATYQAQRHARLIAAYKKDRLSKCKDPASYLVPFKPSDPMHRSYFMHIFSQRFGVHPPNELLPTGIPKWPALLVKKLIPSYPLLAKLADGSISSTHSICLEATQLLAQHKADLYNRKYLDQVDTPTIELPPFNPGSATQLRELFNLMGLESSAVSKKTGLPSWPRDEVERISKEYVEPDIVDLANALIDLSYGDIIATTFIPAFYKYTIDGRLYGNLKLFGAKSFRLTSNEPK